MAGIGQNGKLSEVKVPLSHTALMLRGLEAGPSRVARLAGFMLRDPTLQLVRRCASPRSLAPSHPKQLFLHVAPDGDHWTGPTIFAAKHLPTGFVVSVPIADDFDTTRLTEEQLRQIYDTKALPKLDD
jgi:hypothetical protein